MRGARKRGGDLLTVAVVEVQAHIARCLCVQLRCIGRCRGTRGGDRGERVDIDENGLRGILRLLHGFRHNHGDGFANVAHAIGGQRLLRRPRRRRPISVFPSGGRHVADTACRKISGRDNQMHTGHRACHVRVHRADRAMRHPAAHHHAIELVRQVQIVGIAAFATEQDRVFLARYRLADGKFRAVEQRWVERCVHSGFAFVACLRRSAAPYPSGYIVRAQPIKADAGVWWRLGSRPTATSEICHDSQTGMLTKSGTHGRYA
jgi:hypothetical protein